MSSDVDARLRFLAERRAATVRRYDTLHSPRYDEHWGEIGSTHHAFVERLLERVGPRGEVLDAACGTGKYWPLILSTGLQLMGVDQSAGMLAQAARKHPQVPTRRLALQDLLASDDLLGRFDGLLCVDALENVGPEDWPGVTGGLAGALRRGAPAYVSIELHPGPLPAPADPRQVPGELVEGGGYHFYPSLERVDQWLGEAGFAVDGAADADDYRHLLLTRS